MTHIAEYLHLPETSDGQLVSGPPGPPCALITPGISSFFLIQAHISTMFTPNYVFLTNCIFQPVAFQLHPDNNPDMHTSEAEGICLLLPVMVSAGSLLCW